MTEQAEVLSAGDARARVAVLEAEVEELRKRVSVPDGPYKSLIGVFAMRVSEELEKHDISGYAPVVLAIAEDVLGGMLAAHAPVERVEQEAVAGLVSEAEFLLDRLSDMEQCLVDDELCREYQGHVVPSAERLRMLLDAHQSGGAKR